MPQGSMGNLAYKQNGKTCMYTTCTQAHIRWVFVCVRTKNIGCKALAITWLELLQVLDVALRCESPEFVLDERCS